MSAMPLRPQRLHGAFGDVFRAFLAQGELRYARCAACGEVLGYAQRRCRHGHAGLDWERANGEATLVALATYHRSYSDALSTPYTVVQVELVEGPRLVAWLAASCTEPYIGMALFARIGVDRRLDFTPA